MAWPKHCHEKVNANPLVVWARFFRWWGFQSLPFVDFQHLRQRREEEAKVLRQQQARKPQSVACVEFFGGFGEKAIMLC